MTVTADTNRGICNTHPHQKNFLRQKMKSIQGAGNLRPILGTQTCFWPLTHPPGRGGRGSFSNSLHRPQLPAMPTWVRGQTRRQLGPQSRSPRNRHMSEGGGRPDARQHISDGQCRSPSNTCSTTCTGRCSEKNWRNQLEMRPRVLKCSLNNSSVHPPHGTRHTAHGTALPGCPGISPGHPPSYEPHPRSSACLSVASHPPLCDP